MSQHRHLLATATILATSITGMSNISFEERQRLRLHLLRSETARQIRLTPLDRAYLDVLTLLEQKNSCSEFYGGSAARQILDKLVIKLRSGLVAIDETTIGVRMSGGFTSIVDAQNGISYRMFEHAEINSIGPFYRSKRLPTERFVPNVGSFRPNTREARVLILLHELAHLIRGRDGAWLIPDDAGNPERSRQNTLTVESKCGQQIRAL